jgi:hypothetical protein
MIAPLAKFIDWLAIQVLAILLPRFNARNPRLEEAIQLLKGPDFIPAESQPAQVEFNAGQSGLHFHFPTPRPGGYAENNIVYGRLYRCTKRWQERPVIILLHGGGGFPCAMPQYLSQHHCQEGTGGEAAEESQENSRCQSRHHYGTS